MAVHELWHAIVPQNSLSTFYTAAAFLPIALAAYLSFQLFNPLPKGSPPLIDEDRPVIGTLRFFTARWDFFREAISNSPYFAFHVGQKHVIGLSGDDARRQFFDSKDLDFAAGYGALLAGHPSPPEKEIRDNVEVGIGGVADLDWARWYNIRIQALLKGNIVRKSIPTLIADIRTSFDQLLADPSGITDPFDSIYRLVYHLTVRTVGCKEVADDPKLVVKSLRLFEEVESAATMTNIMYPWIPIPAKLKRLWGGARLYMMFKSVMDKRIKEGSKADDAMNYLMNQGDDETSIIKFIIASLFAGLLNSGINAAWLLIYLTQSPEWQSRARAEIESVAAKYDSDTTRSLADRLSSVPGEAWETEFPVLDICLRETIRIQVSAAAFRKNNSTKPIKFAVGGSAGKDDNGNNINHPPLIIQPGSHVAYHMADVHLNPEIYPNPLHWDPDRYSAGRAEDKKRTHAYAGWGLGRHPCLGQRFAKLESNLITAFFLAYFDFEICDAKGRTEGMVPPPIDLNAHSAKRPLGPCFLKYKARQGVE